MKILYQYQRMLTDETSGSITRTTWAGGGGFKHEGPIKQKTECRCATPAGLQKHISSTSQCVIA